jgi:hypothetical protein
MASYGFVDPKFTDRKKHSRLGIASSVLSLWGFVAFFLFIIYIVLHSSTGTKDDENQLAYVLIGIFAIVSLLITLVGIGLGIAGIIQKNRNRFFAIIGLVFNGLTVLTFGLLMVYGSIVSKH